MPTAHDALLQQLRATFQVEAAEHLDTLSEGLLALEGGTAGTAMVESLFRAVHSLKGAARAVEFPQLESLCQVVEDIMDGWKRGHAAADRPSLDALHGALDAMSALLAAPLVPPAAVLAQAQAARRALQALAAGARRAVQPSPVASQPAAAAVPAPSAAPVVAPSLASPLAPAAVPAPPDAPEAPSPPRRASVRVPTAALESQLLQAEELLAAKLAVGHRAADVAGLAKQLRDWRRGWADVEADARVLRHDLARGSGAASMAGTGGAATAGATVADAATQARLARVLDFVGEGLAVMRNMEARADAAAQAAAQDRHTVGKLVDDMLEQAKNLLLLPFSAMSTPFAKLVRDLSHEQGKEAELRLVGDDVKLDKHILEEIKDPLIHLLRNSVDHGVETPSARAAAGKPARAVIAMTVSRVGGNKVRIVLADDGAGIDAAAVTASAVRNGLLNAQEAAALSAAQAQALIFSSGVSSSPAVTRVSGRGLGLAIAREKAESLGGEIAVESSPGQGTVFTLLLPVTRATFRGILVRAAGQSLVVPTAQVERVGRAGDAQVRMADGRQTLSMDGRAVLLVPLAQVLRLDAPPGAGAPPPSSLPYFVIGSGERRVALSVDGVEGEQEVLVRPLRKPLPRVPNIMGTTILGSGLVAPVLNTADLLQSAQAGPFTFRASAPSKDGPAAGAQGGPQARSLLVAEDSITSRMLLKAILESGGWRVTTAVDGEQAFELLRGGAFDLLVSDIEMPRLDGIALTARVRADAALSALPVVLVTTLASREDRERGLHAGANAYIVKGSFDQGDLVETVRRLLGK